MLQHSTLFLFQFTIYIGLLPAKDALLIPLFVKDFSLFEILFRKFTTFLIYEERQGCGSKGF